MPISPEHRKLLDLPGTFARLATIMPDGSPQNTVIWFRREGDTLRMTCEPNAVKARNIRHDPRVAVVVEHPSDPYRFVQFRGHAEVLDDPALGWDEAVAQSRRYLGDRADAYIASIEGSPTVTIVVYPERASEFIGKNATSEV
jgi:PPOX class probable F420-dependent enzyme